MSDRTDIQPVEYRPWRPYWHSGGSIQERASTAKGFVTKTISRAYAWTLLLHYWSDAEAASQMGDRGGARYLANTADSLMKAINAADDWSRCASNVVQFREHA